MTLELDWRAKSKSNYKYSSVTNAYVKLYDHDTSREIGSVTLVAGGTYDTGWEHKTQDTTGMLGDTTNLEIRLRVRDAWSYTWHQQAWFHNVQLYGGYNHPPNSPSNPSPEAGATGSSTWLTLTWEGGDHDGDTVTYDVYFGTDSDPPYEQTTSYLQFSKAGLDYGTTYYWRIETQDEHGARTVGQTWKFRTEPRMYYGYYRVHDMDMLEYYPVNNDDSWHIANAASQCNLVVVTDRVYILGHDLHYETYDDVVVQNGLEMIFDIHPTLTHYSYERPLFGVVRAGL